MVDSNCRGKNTSLQRQQQDVHAQRQHDTNKTHTLITDRFYVCAYLSYLHLGFTVGLLAGLCWLSPGQQHAGK